LQDATLTALRESPVPLGARELAHRVGGRQGCSVAPQSIYRVLRALVRFGMAHRIESERKFVFVEPIPRPQRGLALLCEGCGHAHVRPVDLDRAGFHGEVRRTGFAPERCVLEMRGLCDRCVVQGRNGGDG
jgi:Fur family zinc uptake transcriptional regulator